MQAKVVDQLPSGKEWLYELKLDGYRVVAVKMGDTVRLISRNENDLTRAYPEVAKGVGQLSLHDGVLDGEIVALDANGKPSFQALQHAPVTGSKPRQVYYYAFDLLNLEGRDTTGLPLVERKRLLEKVLAEAPAHVRFALSFEGDRDTVIAAIREQHLEGIIAKRAHSVYESNKRSGAWVKFKLSHEQEFVIGGYTRGAATGVSSGRLSSAITNRASSGMRPRWARGSRTARSGSSSPGPSLCDRRSALSTPSPRARAAPGATA
jgi:bifunctional non-homologous end joining protein LigD